jgi:site-specific DNA recombinase
LKIPQFQGEVEQVVNGLHEPIISEELFNRVQEILTSSKKRGRQLKPKNPELPLRHHIKCPVCSKNLTGSASKGNGGKYYYYHCQRGCNTRFNASEVNNAFLKYLSSIKIKGEILNLYNEILKDIFDEESKKGHYKKSEIDKEIREFKEKQIKADNLLLEGKIDDSSHKRMVENVNNKISQLLSDKSKFENTDSHFSGYLKYGFSLLQNLDKYYSLADLETKEKLLGSIFPNKLIYENGNYRTNGEDNIISLLSENFNEINQSKKGNASTNGGNSLMVAHTGIEPVLSALRGRRVNQLH